MTQTIEIRGAVSRLCQEWADHDEIVIVGPAGTGKSMGASWVIDDLLCTYPGARLLVVRKTRVSITQSFCKTFAKAMHMKGGRAHLFHGRTDETRNGYTYNNGSYLGLAGMDNATRLFSSEWDWIYVEEATELREDEFQSLHRALRSGVLPHQGIVGACNPDTEFHWIPKRLKKGLATLFESRHEDNPWLTDTVAGKKYLARLRDKLSGAVRDRLYLGLWASATGAIYPQFTRSTHVISGNLVLERGRWHIEVKSGLGAMHGSPKKLEVACFLGAVDWGWRAPGCLQIWAVGIDGRRFLVREWYRTEKLKSWWAEICAKQNKELGIERVICDSADPEAIQVFNNYLGWPEHEDDEPIALGSEKTRTSENRTNIDLTRDSLYEMADGYPGVVFLENALQHAPDPSLEDEAKPTRTYEEIPGYVYEDVKFDAQGRELEDKERPRRVNNHGCNALEYLTRYTHGRSWKLAPRKMKLSSESFAAKYGLTPDIAPELFGLDHEPDWKWEYPEGEDHGNTAV